MRRVLASVCVGVCVVGLSAAVTTPASAAPAAPGRATAAKVSRVTAHAVRVSWTNPARRAHTRTQVRVLRGATAPRTIHEGRRAGVVNASRHTLAVDHLASATRYSFAVFATDGHGHVARPAVVHATTRLDAARYPRAYDTPRGTVVQWRNTATPALRRVVVRYARGAAAPTTPRQGRGVPLTGAKPVQARLTTLAADTRYAVSIFSIDSTGRASAPAVTRFTTPPTGSTEAELPGTYSGAVNDSAGAPLIGADVYAYRYREDGQQEVDTVSGRDGEFSFSLAPGDWWIVAGGPDAVGGNSDDTGYTYDSVEVTIVAGTAATGRRLELSPGAALTGRITDTAGRPIAGAVPYLGELEPYVQVPSSSSFSFGYDLTGLEPTAADGSFSLRGVEPGRATQLCAAAQDAAAAGVDGNADYITKCSGRALLLAAGMTRALPDLALTRGRSGVVSGHVHGVDGRGLAAAVYLDSVSDEDDDGGYATSSPDGSYRVTGVGAGRYHVCAYPLPGAGGRRTGYSQACSKSVIRVTAGGVSTGDVALPIGAAAGGRVVGPNGKGLSGVGVLIELPGSDDEDDDSVGSAVTDAKGRWTAVGLPRGSVRACFVGPGGPEAPTGVLNGCWQHGKAFTVVRSRLRTGIDIRLAAGGAVSGTITDDTGEPVAFATVVAAPTKAGGDDDFFDFGYTQTDEDGHYVVRGLPAGKRKICYDTSDFYGTGEEACVRAPVTVRLGRTTRGIDVRTPAPTAISVEVRDTNGTPVAAVNAAALLSCGDDDEDECETTPLLGKARVEPVSSRLTDADGTVLLDGLRGGRYAVCLFAYFGTTVSGGSPTGYADACHGGTAFDVRVSTGRTTVVVMTLADGGSVSGTVTDRTGTPVGGARLTVSGSAADDQPTYAYDGDPDEGDFFDDEESARPQDGSLTGPDGTYSVIGVRPGDQTVCASTTDMNFLAQCLGGRPGNATGGSTVPVVAGADTRADLQLSAGATLSGVITQGGRPTRGAGVVVFTGRSLKTYRESAVGAGGRWSQGGLPAGSYTVCVYPYSAEGAGKCWRNVPWSIKVMNPPLAKAS